MNKKGLGHIRKILAYLMLVLVIGITVNNVVYLHSHILSDQTVITHAHPFDKSADNTPFKTHHHSNFEYTLTQGFGFFLIGAVLSITCYSVIKRVQYYQFKARLFKSAPDKSFLRGPPSMVIA